MVSPGHRRAYGLAFRLGAGASIAVVLAGCAHPADIEGSREPTATTTPVVSVPSPNEARSRLLKLVPAGYLPDACTPSSALAGAVAAVSCGRNLDAGGPTSATYSLFADVGTLQLNFDNTVQSSTVTDCPGRIQSPGPWHHTTTPDKPAGMLMCGNRGDRRTLVWTNDDQLLMSAAQSERGGPGSEQLYAWWASHS